MSPTSRTCVLLACLALGAPGGLSTAEGQDLAGEHARTLQLQRKPKEAIVAYLALINQNRYALEASAPALVGLVECYQMLRGDAEAEAAYRAVAAKYLSKALPLDGVSRLDPDQAKEDLLWKNWTGDPVPWVSRVVGVNLELPTKQGAQKQEVMDVHLVLSGTAPAGLRLPMGREMTDPPLWREMTDLFHKQNPNKVTVTTPDGTSYGCDDLEVSDGARVYVWFKNIPRSVKSFSSIGGSFPLTLVKGITRQEIALKPGTTWTTTNGTRTLVSFKPGGRGYQAEITFAARAVSDQAGSDGSTGRISMSSGEYGPASEEDDDGALPEPIRLKGVSGAILRRLFMSMSGGNITLEFAATEEAMALIWETYQTSTREVPFSLGAVELR